MITDWYLLTAKVLIGISVILTCWLLSSPRPVRYYEDKIRDSDW